MTSSKRAILKSSIGLATSSISSKFLGVFRDILIASCLGAGPAAGAWAGANLAPNLFRRIFGEGAVGTAMVPMLTDSIDRDKDTLYAAQQLRVILLSIGLILMLIVALGITLPLLAELLFFNTQTEPRYWLLSRAIPAAMPYAFFICLAGIATAALNAVKQFFWPGIAGLVFNIFTILLLFSYQFFHFNWSEKQLLVMLCLSVSFSGVIQLFWVILILKKHQLWTHGLCRNLPWRKTLSQLWSLSFPAIIGASALQISLVIDWSLAFLVGPYAAGSLMYAEHIGFLPVSVVAVTLGVVGLSHMASASARGDMIELKSIFNFGLRYTLFLSIPMAFFTGIFAEGVVRVLFERGQFEEESVRQTVWALQFLAIGVPAFCSSKIVVSSFQSRKDMITPVKISIIATVINTLLAFSLMWSLQQAGLAIAISCGATFNNLILLYLLRRDIGSFGGWRILFSILRSFLSSGLAIIPAYLAWHFIPQVDLFRWLSPCALQLIGAGIIFAFSYAILSLLLKAEELEPILRRLKR